MFPPGAGGKVAELVADANQRTILHKAEAIATFRICVPIDLWNIRASAPCCKLWSQGTTYHCVIFDELTCINNNNFRTESQPYESEFNRTVTGFTLAKTCSYHYCQKTSGRDG